jgi:hypothetical protein
MTNKYNIILLPSYTILHTTDCQNPHLCTCLVCTQHLRSGPMLIIYNNLQVASYTDDEVASRTNSDLGKGQQRRRRRKGLTKAKEPKVQRCSQLLACLHQSIAIDLVYSHVGLVEWSFAVQLVCKKLYRLRNIGEQISIITRISHRASRLLNCVADADQSHYRFLLTVQSGPFKMAQDSLLFVIGTKIATTQRLFSTLCGVKTIGIDADPANTVPRQHAESKNISNVPGYDPILVVTRQVPPHRIGSFCPATHVFIDAIGRARTCIRRCVLACANSETVTAIFIIIPESDVHDKELLLEECGLLRRPKRIRALTLSDPELFLHMLMYVSRANELDYHWVYGIEVTEVVRERIRSECYERIPASNSDATNLNFAYDNLTSLMDDGGEVLAVPADHLPLPTPSKARKTIRTAAGGRRGRQSEQQATRTTAMRQWQTDRNRRVAQLHGAA